MSKKTRSMVEALTPEEASFLERGTSRGMTDKTASGEPAAASKGAKERPEQRSTSAPKAPAQVPSPSPSTARPNSSTGTINSRIDSRITTTLLRASFERRMSQQAPWTQRDIIAEALTDWLKKHGFEI